MSGLLLTCRVLLQIPLLNADDTVGVYSTSDSNDGDISVQQQKEALVNRIFQYLITLEETAFTDNTLIRKEDFAQEVTFTLNNKVKGTGGIPDKYDVDLAFSFSLKVTQSKLDDSLIVKVVGPGDIVLAEERLNGTSSNSTLQYNQVWLDAAENAVNHFIAADYTQYRGHWVAYSMNEITKYIADKPEYYVFALRNVQENLETIYE